MHERTDASRDNFAVQQRVQNYCNGIAELFVAVADLRDKEIEASVAYAALMELGLPEDIEKQADKIVHLVYVTYANAPKEGIGAIVYGACVQQATGLRRNA